MFAKKKEIEILNFGAKSQAFTYLFSKLIAQGEDDLLAAEKAEKFAEIVAKGQNLPDCVPEEKNGLQKGIEYCKQLASLKQDNPEIWDFVTGAIGGLAAGFISKKAPAPVEVVKDNIDFDKLN